jgi:hypothetical protein
MIPIIQFSLNCRSDHIEVRHIPTLKGKLKRYRVTTKAGLRRLLNAACTKLKKAGVEKPEEELIIICSSSLDFPQEYTKSKKIIDLCNWLRSE